MPVIIREETAADVDAVRRVNDAAFGQPQEGALVDRLRENDGIVLSLVAELRRKVIGHILFSPVSIVGPTPAVVGIGLGPVAVLPAFQRQGIGSALITEGIARIQADVWPFVVVLGHAAYYPRFGFVRASSLGVQCQWAVADDFFMILPFDTTTAARSAGRAIYRDEFSIVS